MRGGGGTVALASGPPPATVVTALSTEATPGPVNVTTLRLERDGPDGVVARVTLARPDVRNAFDAATIADLRAVFDALRDEAPERLRAVVLAGEGRLFCAGADIAWMRAAMTLDEAANERDALAAADMFRAIDDCPVPVIARVQGGALGGGMGLCAVADVVVAEAGATFGFTETRLGIIPAVIAPFVIAKIGESHARALFPGGGRFDAERALRIGIAHRLVADAAGLDAAVDDELRAILAGGPTAVRAGKRLIRDLRGGDPAAARALSARAIAAQRTTAEAQEGFAAFEGRRPAGWAAPLPGDEPA